jgi:hypothetical protein
MRRQLKIPISEPPLVLTHEIFALRVAGSVIRIVKLRRYTLLLPDKSKAFPLPPFVTSTSAGLEVVDPMVRPKAEPTYAGIL